MSKHEKQVEAGIYIGNQVDKASVKNPISRSLIQGFDRALLKALDSLEPKSIHEAGCGEGRLAKLMESRYGIDILATDFSRKIIEENKALESSRLRFEQESIYDLRPASRHRDIIVCCETLEHLENPLLGARTLASLNARRYLISVPREPVWRLLNMCRGKYLSQWGNTPGHLNHWSRKSFEHFLLQAGLNVDRWLNPFPWLMVIASNKP